MIALSLLSKEEKPILVNLLELYAHDFSEHVPAVLKENGRFDLPLPDVWWTDPAHAAYFLKWDGALAGFALVRRGSRVSKDTTVMDMAEFFVIRGLRRRSVGMHAAQAIFAKYPGRWEIRVRRSNPAALGFWMRVAESRGPVTPEAFRASDVDWDLLRVFA